MDTKDLKDRLTPEQFPQAPAALPLGGVRSRDLADSGTDVA